MPPSSRGLFRGWGCFGVDSFWYGSQSSHFSFSGVEVVQDGKLCFAKSVQSAHSMDPEVGVESRHQFLSRAVIDFPETGHNGIRPGDVKRTLQPNESFATGHRRLQEDYRCERLQVRKTTGATPL